MDQFSSQIRHYRPIAVDKTEVTIYCIAPKGESAEARAQRIRQYEDFFNASGMATPDDLEEFRSCQIGYLGKAAPWNDMCRGAEHWIEGPDEGAEAIGLKPLMSGARTEDEGLFVVQHQLLAGRDARARSRPKQSLRRSPDERGHDMTDLSSKTCWPVPLPRGPRCSTTAWDELAGPATHRTPSSGCRPGTTTTSWSTDPQREISLI